jgi:biopolymer transport protein ExbD
MALSMSKRARRMERRHKKAGPASLNVTSLMDIFTLLVFFLLANSNEVDVLPSASIIQMPESISEQKPHETVVVMVTDDDILVHGETVMTTQAAMAGDGIIAPLRAALMEETARLVVADGSTPAAREVTIMGDKAIPFRLLKKVMATCTDAQYERISLAVTQKQNKAKARDQEASRT